jgi:hypothetical protein
MNAANRAVNNVVNSSSPVTRLIPVLIVLAGLIGLYYLYQYLFGPKTGNSYPLITSTTSANIDPSKPITITSDKLPSLFEGGEFTISTWIYINNWSYRAGFAKSIISVGGPNFDTIRIYLGGYKPKVNIRLHTRDSHNVTSSSDMTTESLSKATQNATFNILQVDSGLTDSSQICDLPEIDLQKWVNLTVAVSGKTVDVYLDGKLARSCVLPKLFKVDAGGYSANLLSYGGFGGQISTTTMYDAALNPEQVYTNYMAGPEPITNLWQWFSSFFAANVNVSVSTSSK